MSLFISMNISGTAIVLFYLLCMFFFKNKFSFRWHMICLKIALFFYLIPIGAIKYLLPFPIWRFINGFEKPSLKILQYTNLVQVPGFGESYYCFKKPVLVITLIWFAAALMYITYQFIQYLRFRQKLLKTSVQLDGKKVNEALKRFPELKTTYEKRKVRIYENPNVEGPFTSGLFCPYIVLPPIEYVPEYCQDIYGHELYHIKNWDVFLKFICLLVIGLHWYNPLIYIWFYQISINSEYYCDECIIRNMDREKRLEYGKLLVYMESKMNKSPIFLSSEISAKKKRVEKRILHIIHYQKKRISKLFIVMLIGIFLLAFFFSLVSYQATLSINQVLLPYEEVVYIDNGVEDSFFEQNELDIFVNDYVGDALNFNEYSRAFVDKNQNISNADFLPIVDECPHQGKEGSYCIHEKSANGSCDGMIYKAKMCGECGIILYEETNMQKYTICIH